MNCYNHSEKEAAGACIGCGKLFCAECLIEIHGKNYCHKCVQNLVDEKDKELDKAASKPAQVFMNAGGGASASSSAASSSGRSKKAPPYPRNSVIVHILLFLFTCGIGNVIYFLYINNRQKEWELHFRE